MDGAISLPVVFEDNCEQDIYSDLVTSLDQLSTAADVIFTNIQARLQHHQNSLSKLNSRISTLSGKIDMVAQKSGSAVTVFAAANYPIESSQTQPSIFGGLGRCAETAEPSVSNKLFKPFEGNPSSAESISETARAVIAVAPREQDTPIELKGKGSLPANITTVPSVLLFNSTQQPYKEYSVVDNLASADNEFTEERRKKQESDLRQHKLLSEAPVSILQGEVLTEPVDYDVEFRPKMKEMEKFVLPSNLDLPDIADINFDRELPNSSIAPSLNRDNGEELSQIMDVAPPPVEISKPKKSPERLQPALVPPPLAPAPSLPSEPPPLPTRRTPSPVSTVVKVGDSENKIGDLLSAIRTSNVSNLRKVSKTEATPQAKGVESKSPVSLAEEMRVKLQRRQKALSGQQDEEEQAQARRQNMLNSTLRVVGIAGKLKSHHGSNGDLPPISTSRAERLSVASNGMFSLDGMGGLEDLLQAREERTTDDKASHSPSLFSGTSDDWDD